MNKRLVFSLLMAGLVFQVAFAQKKPPFWDDIQKFKQKDSISMPASNAVLFVGSSSFTKWVDLENVFKAYNAINRGFGGSTLAQASFYIENLVYPYAPRQVVIYSGENDIAIDQTSAMQTLDRFAIFFTRIRNKFPQAAILYISMKNSPSREKYAETINHANALIKEYLSHYRNTNYVDVNLKMSYKGKPRPELFVEDMLHMNQSGYAIWTREITPYLLKAN